MNVIYLCVNTAKPMSITVKIPKNVRIASSSQIINAAVNFVRLTPEELSENRTELKGIYEIHLKSKGVKFCGGKLGTALTVLYANKGHPIHIDLLKKEVVRLGYEMTGTDPLQVRHLSTQKGWWIEKHGKYEHRLVSVTEVMPGFIAQKRASKLDNENWAKMKHEYNNACVNCGSKDGETLRWDQTKTTVLQQGHMDPRKDLTYDNCIPQCSFCNQQYKSKAVFNNRGFVIDFCKSGF